MYKVVTQYKACVYKGRANSQKRQQGPELGTIGKLVGVRIRQGLKAHASLMRPRAQKSTKEPRAHEEPQGHNAP